ncbi:fibroblast growth factor-binding protein 3 [Callithrix jacchus]
MRQSSDPHDFKPGPEPPEYPLFPRAMTVLCPPPQRVPLQAATSRVCGRGVGRCKCLGEVLRLAQLVAVSASSAGPGKAPCLALPRLTRSEKSGARKLRRLSPPRLRASLSPSLPLLSGFLLAAARGEKGAAGNVVEPVPGPAGGSSGRFLSPEQHPCSWQLLLPAPGATAGSELALLCQSRDGARHRCPYRGEQESCAAYAASRSHFWKQVMGRLRHDPAPLQARLCAGKKGHRAELRLEPRASPTARPTAAGFAGKPKPKPGAGSRGRPRERAPGAAAGTPLPQSAPPKEKPSERKTKGGKRKAASVPNEERPLGPGPTPTGWTGTRSSRRPTALRSGTPPQLLCQFLERLRLPASPGRDEGEGVGK